MAHPEQQTWSGIDTGPASVTDVMAEWERLASSGQLMEFQPLATGFSPLDDVLNGGIRPGELVVIGGPYGVGKTVLGLQMARNVVRAHNDAKALYVCYEHDRTHLLSRLLCMESVERDGAAPTLVRVPIGGGASDGGAADGRRASDGVRASDGKRASDGVRAADGGATYDLGDRELTLRKLAQLAGGSAKANNLVQTLRSDARYGPLLRKMRQYGDRLILARASGMTTGLDEIAAWIQSLRTTGTGNILVVVDYLQKVAVDRSADGNGLQGALRDEDAVTTYLMHGLKEMALSQQVQMVAIAAADRASMQGRRMRLADLRGSSAMQYETDIGLVLNNKYDIVSREHLIYNLADAEAMRSWVVLTLEKNRAGRHAVDMEFALDAPHFRLVPNGSFVRERLIDGKAVIE